MPNTFELLGSATVGSGGASSFAFSSIPQTYTDLKLVVSGRVSGSGTDFHLNVYLNGSTSGYTARAVYGTGTAAGSYSSAVAGYSGSLMGSSGTANVFGCAEVYIPNYTSSNYKSYSVDNVTENNSTTVRTDVLGGLWSNTAAVSSMTVTTDDGTAFVQYTTASLYGISKT
jgi:hypothetical protein